MSDQNELNSADTAARIVALMPSSDGVNPFIERYADLIEKAAELDDLSFVRLGREAEQFEIGFRRFVAEFPGAPAVTIPEGEFVDLGVYFARIDRELRAELLKGWAAAVRAKAHQYSS
jgi:hypothetical protein